MRQIMGTKVFVYYNLHKKCWSVKALSGPNKGRVIAHCDKIVLRDPEFRVSQAGRRRVIRERRKNVHAGVAGYVMEGDLPCGRWLPTTYNPYKYESFVDLATEVPVQDAELVYMFDKKVLRKEY